MYKKFAFIVAGLLSLFLLMAGYFTFTTSQRVDIVHPEDVTGIPESVKATMRVKNNQNKPPQPAYQTQGCLWEWFEVRDVGIWAEKCTFDGISWRLQQQKDDVLMLMVGDKEQRRALQLFQKPHTRSIESIVNQIADGAPKECVMQKNDIQSGQGRLVYEFVPTGALKRAFEKSTVVPPDPCGPYGISASGQRLFEIWEGHEDIVIFLNYGHDGSLFEYESLVFIR